MNNLYLLLKATVTKVITVPAYTRSDGTYVPAHQKTVHYDPDKSKLDVISGKGTSSQQKAHEKLSKHKDWDKWSDDEKHAHILAHATDLQVHKTFNGNVSKFKKAILEGKVPQAGHYNAVMSDEMGADKRQKLLDELKEKVGAEQVESLMKQAAAKADGKSSGQKTAKDKYNEHTHKLAESHQKVADEAKAKQAQAEPGKPKQVSVVDKGVDDFLTHEHLAPSFKKKLEAFKQANGYDSKDDAGKLKVLEDFAGEKNYSYPVQALKLYDKVQKLKGELAGTSKPEAAQPEPENVDKPGKVGPAVEKEDKNPEPSGSDTSSGTGKPVGKRPEPGNGESSSSKDKALSSLPEEAQSQYKFIKDLEEKSLGHVLAHKGAPVFEKLLDHYISKVQALSQAMGKIKTPFGVAEKLALDEAYGKAVAIKNQMQTSKAAQESGVTAPKEGDTKTVNGVSYVLKDGRWHKVSQEIPEDVFNKHPDNIVQYAKKAGCSKWLVDALDEGKQEESVNVLHSKFLMNGIAQSAAATEGSGVSDTDTQFLAGLKDSVSNDLEKAGFKKAFGHKKEDSEAMKQLKSIVRGAFALKYGEKAQCQAFAKMEALIDAMTGKYSDKDRISLVKGLLSGGGIDELESLSGKDSKEKTEGVKQDGDSSSFTQSTLSQFKHTKTGEDVYAVKLAGKVGNLDFNGLKSTAKKFGGYYSSYSKGGAVSGFLFKDPKDANDFQQHVEDMEFFPEKKTGSPSNQSDGQQEQSGKDLINPKAGQSVEAAAQKLRAKAHQQASSSRNRMAGYGFQAPQTSMAGI